MRSTGRRCKGGLTKAKTSHGKLIFMRLTFGLKTKIGRQDAVVKAKESNATRSAVAAFADSIIGQVSEEGSLFTEKLMVFEDSSAQVESSQSRTQAAKIHKKLMDSKTEIACLNGI